MNHQNIRIIQLIDSLETGGAERMAVNYANTLSDKIAFSGLVATREEGLLKECIVAKVDYLFLDRNKILDIKALIKFRKYLKKNKVQFIQAHSSSYFFGVLLKLIMPKVNIIWHDHYGFRYKRSFFSNLPLIICSFFFDRIIVVNHNLKEFAEKKLFASKVTYLPNFTLSSSQLKKRFLLNGFSGKRILCLANLRPEKNHFLLLDVAKKISEIYPDWTFHLVGKNFENAYSNQIIETINRYNLQNFVYLYGAVQDTIDIIEQVEIVVLTSDSEGLPVSLLEAGFAGKPVVATAVGEIPNFLSDDFGYLVPPKNCDVFCEKLKQLIENRELRNNKGIAFQIELKKQFDHRIIIDNFLAFIL